jgi:hypothetical protein
MFDGVAGPGPFSTGIQVTQSWPAHGSGGSGPGEKEVIQKDLHSPGTRVEEKW